LRTKPVLKQLEPTATTDESMTPNWRDEWERQADLEMVEVDRIPVEGLIDQVRAGKYGNYYCVWRSIAARATLAQAGWILFDILARDVDYLYRYHCASALLQLLKNSSFGPVQLSSPAHNSAENLKVVRSLLEDTIGKHP
jgi:hypothetical protein